MGEEEVVNVRDGVFRLFLDGLVEHSVTFRGFFQRWMFWQISFSSLRIQGLSVGEWNSLGVRSEASWQDSKSLVGR